MVVERNRKGRGTNQYSSLRGQLAIVTGRILRLPPRFTPSSVHTPYRYSNTNFSAALKELQKAGFKSADLK